jgi:hypothetical protein
MNRKVLKSLLQHGYYKQNISDANLRGGDLRDANLRGADLRGANLIDADLSDANLIGANLIGADLSDANLSDADLIGANLRGADLRGANLRGANLSDADLSDADLRGADLRGANHNYKTIGISIGCPEVGEFIGYKKAEGKIITLKIHHDSLRSSATSTKCRCNIATILEIEGGLPIISDYDSKFNYEVGKVMEVSDFDTDRWNECSTGILFFMNRHNAETYN